MDEEIDRLVVSVRADTRGFSRDVAAMRGELEGPLAQGAGRAGRIIDTALGKAIASGKIGFDDLKRVALQAMSEIAQASLRGLFRGSGAGSELGGALSGIVAALAGAPGRATGGPVSGGRAYWVGERGPELFVPGADGRIERASQRIGGGEVKVAIAIHGPGGESPQLLRRSSRQIASAVRSAVRERR